jgi:hypothetical protein
MITADRRQESKAEHAERLGKAETRAEQMIQRCSRIKAFGKEVSVAPNAHGRGLGTAATNAPS